MEHIYFINVVDGPPEELHRIIPIPPLVYCPKIGESVILDFENYLPPGTHEKFTDYVNSRGGALMIIDIVHKITDKNQGTILFLVVDDEPTIDLNEYNNLN